MDINKINDLLKEGKMEEAKSAIKSFISEPVSKEDRGEALYNMIKTYIQTMNAANVEYKAYLEKTLESLNNLNKEESAISDSISLKQIRQKLAQ